MASANSKVVREVKLGSRYFMWRDFELWLTSMESMGGLRMRFTRDRKGTVAVIRALYKWWTDKDWDEHRSHMVANKSSGVLGVRHSLKRRIAAQLPGIGEGRSKDVAEYFESIQDMMIPEHWEQLEVKGIGKKTIEKIVKELSK